MFKVRSSIGNYILTLFLFFILVFLRELRGSPRLRGEFFGGW
jgi:hypothetical protein